MLVLVILRLCSFEILPGKSGLGLVPNHPSSLVQTASYLECMALLLVYNSSFLTMANLCIKSRVHSQCLNLVAFFVFFAVLASSHSCYLKGRLQSLWL